MPRRLLSSLSQWRPWRLANEAVSISVIWHWLRSRLWRSCNNHYYVVREVITGKDYMKEEKLFMLQIG